MDCLPHVNTPKLGQGYNPAIILFQQHEIRLVDIFPASRHAGVIPGNSAQKSAALGRRLMQRRNFKALVVRVRQT
jgi:hypothetical protein